MKPSTVSKARLMLFSVLLVLLVVSGWLSSAGDEPEPRRATVVVEMDKAMWFDPVREMWVPLGSSEMVESPVPLWGPETLYVEIGD